MAGVDTSRFSFSKGRAPTSNDPTHLSARFQLADAGMARPSPAAGRRQSHDAQEVVVTHGQRVETRPEWFGEIVWAGDLDEAAFDHTDLVFGSGARVRGTGGGASELVFVPAGTTVDRLQWIEAGGYLWISNSLACLLAQVAGELDPADGGWFDRLGSITRGIDGYERELPTSAGTVRLNYFHNLAWSGGALREVAKPHSVHGFATFEGYRDYLAASIAAVATNAADPRRSFPTPILGTLSGGYDSPMVSVLASRAAGLREAFNF